MLHKHLLYFSRRSLSIEKAFQDYSVGRHIRSHPQHFLVPNTSWNGRCLNRTSQELALPAFFLLTLNGQSKGQSVNKELVWIWPHRFVICTSSYLDHSDIHSFFQLDQLCPPLKIWDMLQGWRGTNIKKNNHPLLSLQGPALSVQAGRVWPTATPHETSFPSIYRFNCQQ